MVSTTSSIVCRKKSQKSHSIVCRKNFIVQHVENLEKMSKYSMLKKVIVKESSTVAQWLALLPQQYVEKSHKNIIVQHVEKKSQYSMLKNFEKKCQYSMLKKVIVKESRTEAQWLALLSQQYVEKSHKKDIVQYVEKQSQYSMLKKVTKNSKFKKATRWPNGQHCCLIARRYRVRIHEVQYHIKKEVSWHVEKF